MITAIPEKELVLLVARQLKNVFLLSESDHSALEKGVSRALERAAYCFSFNQNKYFRHDGAPYFSPFHVGQNTIFLYYLSNTIWKELDNSDLADRIYYLNRMLNTIDLFYEVDLPDVFALDHALGSVMGRATYSNFLSFSQNCTVGNNKGAYPHIGERVTLFSGVTIVGDCRIGANSVLAAGTYVKDEIIEENSLVFGKSPHLEIKSKDREYLFAMQQCWTLENNGKQTS